MGKLFWVSLGAAAGVLVVRRVTRTAASYTPEGVASSLAGVGEAIRDFAAAVREGMDTRETELRVALGVDAGAVDAETARQLIENPTSPRG
jgi:chromosome condensin MukBEF MukE localization factor